MDIEGYETLALEGARKTISNHKPVLLISIYHRPSAFFDARKIISECGQYEYIVRKLVSYHPVYETSIIAYPREAL